MKTSTLIAERLKNAELVLNIDGSSGTLSEETGKPLYWSWHLQDSMSSEAEK